MAFKVVPTKCPVCQGEFMAESYQVYRAKLKGRVPCCSRKCEQERRFAATRDAKWAKQLASKLNRSPN